MRFLLFLFTFITPMFATEPLQPEHLKDFLKNENPYVINAKISQNSALHKITYAQGFYDTTLLASYHNKNYPTTTGEFSDISLNQPLLNGMNLQAGWRQSLGTQEYNNIKTGSDGEARIGLNVDATSLLLDMNTPKFNLLNAKLEYEKNKQSVQDNLQDLDFMVMEAYWNVRYYKSRLKLVENLLKRTQMREKFVLKRIKSGTLAQLASIEIEQQIINTKQYLLLSKNLYENGLTTLLKFLSISQELFDENFYIEPLVITIKTLTTVDEFFEKALEQRADLKALKIEEKQLFLENKAIQSLQYPTFKIGTYGVHDFKYNEDGYKVTFDMNFALQQNQYEGKSKLVQTKKKSLQAKIDIFSQNLKTEIINNFTKLNMLQTTIQFSQEEIVLLERLEKAEEKRYILGISNLFLLNQREIATLNLKIKLLEYQLQYQQLSLALKRDVADSIF